jgi:formylglycine-generating enzyme required for sulfatase activity
MKHRILLATFIGLAVVTLSCGLGRGLLGGEELPPPTQAPAASAGEQTSPTQPPPPEAAPIPPAQSPRIRPIDGMTMVHIPAGEFLMGSDETPFAYERPQHIIFLDEYWIDRTEVSNAQYRLCVEAGSCAEPQSWADPNFSSDNQPAIVTWEGAHQYCQWVDGRLPTEAEWEKAARGTDGRMWPWGNEFEPNRANLSDDADGYGFTAPVGSFPGDASPYGLLDVAGNAAEWVADWYDAEYYAHSPARNPTGPGGGDEKIHRGTISNAGGGPEKCRCVSRYPSDPNWEYGFRCVATIPPGEEAAPPPPSSGEAEIASEATTPPESGTEPGAPPTEAAPPVGEVAPAGSDPADIPIYPGASLLGSVADIPDQYKTDYEMPLVLLNLTQSRVTMELGQWPK